jgi:transposase
LASAEIPRLDRAGVAIHAKPWTAHNGGRFPKSAFQIRLADRVVECPAHQITPLGPGQTSVHFPAATCAACALRAACTTAATGRTITIHPQEALLQRLRTTAATATGRTTLRRRTAVEHSLARLDQLQGRRARYKGTRKNTLDLRRCAAVINLQRLARLDRAA